jgi:outer membrane receptor for ferrienterochelin and colicins
MKCVVGKYAVAVLALLLFAVPAWAQTGTITGQVRVSDTLAPLPGAVVQVFTADGGRAGSTLANQSGRFVVVNLPAGTYTVTATLTGYATGRAENVRVVAGQSVSLNLDLRSRAIDIDPVVVSASRRQERALDAPARVEVVGQQAIEERPAVTPVDHIRAVPGVDIATHGLQSANVVARGFNNIFSGALYMLTDHRLSGVPSLRVNLMHLIPSNNEDMERIEVVLGPGSALYGPNTANGVMHIFTRSPLTQQGTVVSVAGGERSIFNGSFRTAHLVGENFGFKVSGEYLRGNEWEYTDSIEARARTAELARPNPNPRIGVRNFDIERWAGEARADWRITPELTSIFSVGRTTAMKGIELTGIGASQIDNWTYTYYQARTNWNRFFGQVYLNQSNAGDTYTLRDGNPIVDESSLLVGQLQHGFALGLRQNFTYGVDYFQTMPDTRRTIHGRYEDDDETREVGAYLQSETAVHRMVDLVLAGRVDNNDRLPETVFSPRAAVVLKPVENQSFRLTYNRAFSTPRSLDMFLDISAGPFPNPALAQFGSIPGYGLRAQAPGSAGYAFRGTDPNLRMRSPFAVMAGGDPSALLPLSTPAMWQTAVTLMHANGAFGVPTSPQALGTRNFLLANAPTDAQVGKLAWEPWITQTTFSPLESFSLEIPPLRESYTETFEVGYKGILGNRLLLAADLWHSTRDNFVSALRPVSPLVALNGAQVAAHLVGRGLSPEQAGAIAAGMQGIPLGVLATEATSSSPGRAEILVSYRNFGRISYWGSDLAAQFLVNDRVTLGANASFINKDHFVTEGQTISLNAPRTKLSASAGYRDRNLGFNSEVRVRHNAEFPVISAPFEAGRCIDLPGQADDDPCVSSSTLVDVTLGYRIPRVRGTSLQLLVQNAFDSPYRSFPGVPEVGRMAILRLRQEF